MSSASRITIPAGSPASPVLVFSGTGNVLLKVASGPPVEFGGPGVTVGAGYQLSSLQLNINSPDEIWAISTHASVDSEVHVLEVR